MLLNRKRERAVSEELEFAVPKEPELPEELGPTGHEFDPPPSPIRDRKKKGLRDRSMSILLMKAAAVALSVVVIKDAAGYDLLGGNVFADSYSSGSSSGYYNPSNTVNSSGSSGSGSGGGSKSEDSDDDPMTPAESDKADSAFPKLSNLDPNGTLPEYECYNEQYVRVEHLDSSKVDYLYCIDGVWNYGIGDWWIDDEGLHMSDGSVKGPGEYAFKPGATWDEDTQGPYSAVADWAWIIDSDGILSWHLNEDDFYTNEWGAEVMKDIQPLRKAGNLPIGPIDGASYNELTNTLTLENFNDPNARVNVNLMGNGFKIKLVGDNTLDSILAWGFHYGGSVTFTGTGSLTVYSPESTAITLRAEDSESCIMIDSGVTLDVYGGYGAIMVTETTCDKGIYYLSPSVMKTDPAYSPRRAFGPFASSVNYSGKCYSIVDEYNGPIVHVWFGPEED